MSILLKLLIMRNSKSWNRYRHWPVSPTFLGSRCWGKKLSSSRGSFNPFGIFLQGCFVRVMNPHKLTVIQNSPFHGVIPQDQPGWLFISGSCRLWWEMMGDTLVAGDIARLWMWPGSPGFPRAFSLSFSREAVCRCVTFSPALWACPLPHVSLQPTSPPTSQERKLSEPPPNDTQADLCPPRRWPFSQLLHLPSPPSSSSPSSSHSYSVSEVVCLLGDLAHLLFLLSSCLFVSVTSCICIYTCFNPPQIPNAFHHSFPLPPVYPFPCSFNFIKELCVITLSALLCSLTLPLPPAVPPHPPRAPFPQYPACPQVQQVLPSPLRVPLLFLFSLCSFRWLLKCHLPSMSVRTDSSAFPPFSGCSLSSLFRRLCFLFPIP